MREDLYKRFGLTCNNFKRTFQKGRNGGPILKMDVFEIFILL